VITEEQIQLAVDILVREARPLKVILFGSYARGDARDDSDVDFLVIEREVPGKNAEMVRLDKALSPMRLNADVLVASEAHVSSSWGGFPGTYLYDALREGKVMYAVDGAGEAVAA
jgi:predicted nucleotidyltransferase